MLDLFTANAANGDLLNFFLAWLDVSDRDGFEIQSAAESAALLCPEAP